MTELLANTITDMVSNFLYYDRKEDEEMPVGFIENEIRSGRLTVEEIVDKFRWEFGKGVGEV